MPTLLAQPARCLCTTCFKDRMELDSRAVSLEANRGDALPARPARDNEPKRTVKLRGAAKEAVTGIRDVERGCLGDLVASAAFGRWDEAA